MLSHIEWTSRKCIWSICRRNEIFSIDEITGRNFLIAISLRSPKFSNYWLSSILDDIFQEFHGQALICLVDFPYHEKISNLCDQCSDLEIKLLNLKNQRDQQLRRIDKLIKKFDSVIPVFNFNDLLNLVPVSLFDEIEKAYILKNKVYESINSQVYLSVKDLKNISQVENESIFLRKELPVLVYIYYKFLNTHIDVYPGPQSHFFWNLEEGFFKDELPISSEMAATSGGLTYADVTCLDAGSFHHPEAH